MASNSHDQLHFIFFPQPGQGHLIPTVEMARLFARHGVKATILTFPLIAPLFENTLQRERELGFEISTLLMKFPAAEVGLPEGCEHVGSLTTQEMSSKYLKAVELLQQPFEHLLEEIRPHCIVADLMFPWATDIAAKFGIPRLMFEGTSCFSLCVSHSLKQHQPFKNIADEYEPFDLPGLPDQIKMTRSQLSEHRKKNIDNVKPDQFASYGVIVNSFNELEPAYAQHLSKVMGRKAWLVGPVSLCNTNKQDRAERGNPASNEYCLQWLDSKKPKSVLYISFGTIFKTSAAQLNAIAKFLEGSEHGFIWVVRKADNEEEWLPQGFEERMEGKGLIIRDWAPQILILDHQAIGGVMTHCGWNSTIESITAGIPMVTWPFYTEQFCNEILVVDVLKIGVRVGAKDCSSSSTSDSICKVSKEDIERAVSRVMAGEEAEEMRNKAKELKGLAKKAVEEGGSSYSDLNALLDEFKLKLN